MKTREQPADGMELTDRKVAAYLRKTPDFFQRHPALLNHVVFPHDAGAASSLVERQVLHLQNERRNLKNQLRALTEVARENEQSMRRMHRLLLKLLRCEGLEELLKTLYVSLRAQFSVNAVAIRLQLEERPDWQGRMREFIDNDERLPALLRELGIDDGPVCCKLDRQRADVLFGAQACDELASYALIPLGNSRWRGVVGMGSEHADRFSEAHAGDLLKSLGDILTTLLDTHIP